MPAYGPAKKRAKWQALTGDPLRFCGTTGKQKRSKGGAKKSALQRTAESGKPLFFYKCRFCRTWHMTSQKPRVKA